MMNVKLSSLLLSDVSCLESFILKLKLFIFLYNSVIELNSGPDKDNKVKRYSDELSDN